MKATTRGSKGSIKGNKFPMCRSDTYHCAAVVFGWFHNMASEGISGHSTAH